MARTSGRRFHGLLFAAALALAFTTGSPAGAAENPEIAKRRAAERKTFTDSEITDGFFKLTFGSEFQVAGRADRIRKFDGPVRVFITSSAKPIPTMRHTAATVSKSPVPGLEVVVTSGWTGVGARTVA